MFIQLLRANSSTIFAQFYAAAFFFRYFSLYISYFIQQTFNGAHKIKSPSQSKGLHFLKRFHFTQSFSISSSDLFFVSGQIVTTNKKQRMLMTAKIQNV